MFPTRSILIKLCVSSMHFRLWHEQEPDDINSGKACQNSGISGRVTAVYEL